MDMVGGGVGEDEVVVRLRLLNAVAPTSQKIRSSSSQRSRLIIVNRW